METGGKNAGIVFEDADLDLAVKELGRSCFLNSGQVCLGTERVYVHESIFDEVADRLVDYAKNELKYGYPDDEATNFGPVVSDEHRDKVLSYYKLAEEEGAEVLHGGGAPTFGDERDGGSWVEPTIWKGLAHDSRVATEEIFGPAVALIPFTDEDEVIKLANDTDYGLAATFFTTNSSRVHRVAPQLEAGIIWVNSWFLRDLRTAFGGMKHSRHRPRGRRARARVLHRDVQRLCEDLSKRRGVGLRSRSVLPAGPSVIPLLSSSDRVQAEPLTQKLDSRAGIVSRTECERHRWMVPPKTPPGGRVDMFGAAPGTRRPQRNAPFQWIARRTPIRCSIHCADAP